MSEFPPEVEGRIRQYSALATIVLEEAPGADACLVIVADSFEPASAACHAIRLSSDKPRALRTMIRMLDTARAQLALDLAAAEAVSAAEQALGKGRHN